MEVIMSKLIITTVGTSVISNELYPKEFNNYINELTNGKPLRDEIKRIVTDRTVEKINLSVITNLPKNMLSAEISSIKAFKFNKDLGLSKDDDVIALFSTDTEDGKFCAEVNKKVLEKLGWCKVLETITITGLKTKKIKENEDISKNFKEVGLKKLKEEIDKLLENSKYKQQYFNITGGYKAIVPFATILAFEKGMSLLYLYEESDDLILIKPPEKFYCSFDEMRENTRIKREILEI